MFLLKLGLYIYWALDFFSFFGSNTDDGGIYHLFLVLPFRHNYMHEKNTNASEFLVSVMYNKCILELACYSFNSSIDNFRIRWIISF